MCSNHFKMCDILYLHTLKRRPNLNTYCIGKVVSKKKFPFLILTKAELLQIKPHPFICIRNCITKKVGNRKNSTFITPTPWLTLLFVLGKSRVKQNLC